MKRLYSQTLCEDLELRIKIAVEFGINNQNYGAICQVRGKGGAKEVCYNFDEYSYHYVMLHESTPIGALTTTKHRDGPIDCIQHYPMGVLERFGDAVGSKCKFWIIDSRIENRLAAMRRMMTAVSKHQLSQGTRLDIINAKRDLVKFYKWMGYHPVPGHDFVHPSLGTDSVVLLLSADPNWKSHFQSLFRDLADPLPMPKVLAEIDRFNLS